MTDDEIIYRETMIPVGTVPAGLRSLTADLCRLSMGELLLLAEKAEARDARKGAMVRQVWERRRDCAELRKTLARRAVRP